jgi:uncharacterized protein (TIGR02147 family)
MKAFDFDDYKTFLDQKIRALPKNGRGEARKLAEHISVNSVVISQVLRGDKHFTLEQAIKVCSYFGLQGSEQEYFILLVSRARAGSQDLIEHYTKKLVSLKKEQKKLTHAVASRELGDHEKSIFYSNWFYSGVRILTTIDGKNTPDAIAEYFGLSRAKVHEILNFLMSVGLVKEQNGTFSVGVASTYVDSTSKFVNGHRRNWRLKAMEKFTEPSEDDLFYSNPHSISQQDYEAARAELAQVIQKHTKRVAGSDPEVLACLNVDFFKF